MAFIDTEENQYSRYIENRHSQLASKHGRDNVFITEVNGEVVTLVGEGVGLIEPLEVATTQFSEGVEIDGYPVEPALVPLFEEPVSWFEGNHDLFELAAGGTGRVCSLSPSGIVFLDFGNRRFYEERVDRYGTNETIGSVPIVATEADAIASDEHSTWISTDNTSVWTYEYVPFVEPVQTTAQLEAQLGSICSNTPEWDDLFEATTAVYADELADELAADA